MFDDPGKQLQWLEEELLEAEDEQLPEEEAFDQDFFTQEDLEQALYGPDQPWLEEEPEQVLQQPSVPHRKRRFARKTKAQRRVETVRLEEEAQDEPMAVFDDRPKRKGVGGLLFLALLELIGIVLVALWWVQWLG